MWRWDIKYNKSYINCSWKVTYEKDECLIDTILLIITRFLIYLNTI